MCKKISMDIKKYERFENLIPDTHSTISVPTIIHTVKFSANHISLSNGPNASTTHKITYRTKNSSGNFPEFCIVVIVYQIYSPRIFGERFCFWSTSTTLNCVLPKICPSLVITFIRYNPGLMLCLNVYPRYP